MKLFFFGSLTDRELLRIVLGHDGAALVFQQALLAGYRTHRMVDDRYPILVPASSDAVPGLVVGGLHETDIARIRFYEEDEYSLEPIAVETTRGQETCLACLAIDPSLDSGERWFPNSWTAEERELILLMTEEHMSHFGRTPLEEVAEMWEEFERSALRRLRLRRRA